MILRNFLDAANVLIISHISKPYIKTTRIKHIANYRDSLDKLPKEQRILAIKLLDQMIVFAKTLNAEGIEVAEKHAQDIRVTIDELIGLVT